MFPQSRSQDFHTIFFFQLHLVPQMKWSDISNEMQYDAKQHSLQKDGLPSTRG